MAEGFARHFGKGQVEVFSAGSHPAGIVAPLAVEVLTEIGIDLSDQRSKGLKEVPQGPYDAVVTMGCGDACPWIPAKQRFDWNIPDPIGQDRVFFVSIRNMIEQKVKELLLHLKVNNS